jgi:hypothetical protein
VRAEWRSKPACLLLLAVGLACGGVTVPEGDLGGEPPTDEPFPLTELGGATYLGFEGGLYPGGGNDPPPDHASAGLERAARIRPLDREGNPDPDGRYVLLSVGMSNTTQEFCTAGGAPACDPWTFTGQARADPAVNHSTLAIVNGARGGQDAETWDSPADPNYDRVRDERLAPLGLTEGQVQVAWVKEANARPIMSLPDRGADAYQLEASLGRIVRALTVRYPNLQQVYVSSRIYGGYADGSLNPEPYAYESGFAVKWLVEAQIEQSRTGSIDAESGDLGLEAGAPLVGWGPYLWADGGTPRSDGLVWLRADFAADGTHPSMSGERKVGALLLDFFKTTPYARCWFLSGAVC